MNPVVNEDEIEKKHKEYSKYYEMNPPRDNYCGCWQRCPCCGRPYYWHPYYNPYRPHYPPVWRIEPTFDPYICSQAETTACPTS